MSRPKQVQKQVEEVNELYRQMIGGEGAPTDDGKDTSDESKSDTEEPPAQPKAEPQTVEADEFKHKYRTLQGMYNALDAKFRTQSAELADLRKALEEKEKAPPPVTKSVATDLTEEEVEAYGDSIDIMRRVANQVSAPLLEEIERLNGVIQNLNKSVVPTVKKIETSQAELSQERFFTTLSNRLPNWEQQNQDDKFLDWLDEVDPISGQKRQAYLDQAVSKQDVEQVVRIFTAFPGTVTTQTPKPKPSSELEKQVTPGRGHSSDTRQPQEDKVYSPEEIKAFYAAVARGDYREKGQEKERIEAAIFRSLSSKS